MSLSKSVLSQLRTTSRVEDIVQSVSEQTGEKPEAVAKELYQLAEMKKVILVEPTPPAGLIDYLKRPYGAWVSAILLFMALTLASIYLIPQYPPFIYVRYISGALFVLYVPGYSLIEALYSKADELDQLERLALSIGLSLALVPLVGLVLNYTPWGIRLVPILVSLILLTFILTMVAAHRKLGYVKLSSRALTPK